MLPKYSIDSRYTIKMYLEIVLIKTPKILFIHNDRLTVHVFATQPKYFNVHLGNVNLLF